MKIDECLWAQLIDCRAENIRLQACVCEIEQQLASEKWFTRGVIEENKRLRHELDRRDGRLSTHSE